MPEHFFGVSCSREEQKEIIRDTTVRSLKLKLAHLWALLQQTAQTSSKTSKWVENIKWVI